MGASQSHKSEIDVKMIRSKDRTDDSYVYAARMKLQLEKYWLVPK
jgi:HAE1 family hydrophobic/amphiphilic exporter-1